LKRRTRVRIFLRSWRHHNQDQRPNQKRQDAEHHGRIQLATGQYQYCLERVERTCSDITKDNTERAQGQCRKLRRWRSSFTTAIRMHAPPSTFGIATWVRTKATPSTVPRRPNRPIWLRTVKTELEFPNFPCNFPVYQGIPVETGWDRTAPTGIHLGSNDAHLHSGVTPTESGAWHPRATS
jgi:hypothetical protein